MCGRYFIDDGAYELRELVREIERRQGAELRTGEVYPTNLVPVIRRGLGGKELAVLKWGFPHWQGSGAVINARAESSLDKSMFRKSVMERRCVVPSSGFYEWNRAGGKKWKDKYLLRKPDSDIVYMAGIWSTFKDAEGECEAFVILTTSSNDSMVAPDTEMTLFPDAGIPIHDRMPVILEPEECDLWLYNDAFAQQVLRRAGPRLVLTQVLS